MSLAMPGIFRDKMIYYNVLIDSLFDLELYLKRGQLSEFRKLVDKTITLSAANQDFLTNAKLTKIQVLDDKQRALLLREVKLCQKIAEISGTAALEARHNVIMEVV